MRKFNYMRTWHDRLNAMVILSRLLLLSAFIALTACGFHLQGEMQLAPPLHKLYIQAPDPYNQLVRTLQQYCKMSKINLVKTPTDANTILVILRDDATEEFLNVSGTQQTRQYDLKVTVEFEITDAHGVVIMPPETLSENQTITIQSSQILSSSNEANLFYQQMRRALAYAIMNRISSKEVTEKVNAAFAPPAPKVTKKTKTPVTKKSAQKII